MNTELPGGSAMERNDGASSGTLARVLIALVIFGITFATVMVAAGVLCFYLPRQFYSQATIEVKQSGFRDERGPFLQPTQFQIPSKEVLYPVIDNLKLVEAWGKQQGGRHLSKEEVYGTLLNRIQLTAVRNTDLIQIGVFSPDRVEAANLANMIAVVYKKVLQDNQLQIRDAALAQLREEVKVQRKNGETLKAKMQEIGAKEGTVDPNPEEVSQGNSENQSEAYRNAKDEYLKAKPILDEAEKRLSIESVQLKMSDAPAKIWDKAEPAMYPSKPNVAAIMFIAAAVGVFLGLVFAGIYLLTSRPRRPSPAAVAKAV